MIFTVENFKCNFLALHSTSTDSNEWINSLLTLAQVARLCDPGNNQTLAEQKWKINSNWLFKLRISGYSGRIYSKPSPGMSTLWIHLISQLSRTLHSTLFICNQNCYFIGRHRVCWCILYIVPAISFSLTDILASTYLMVVLSFGVLNLVFRCFSCMSFYFRPPALLWWCPIEQEWWGGVLPIWSQPNQAGSSFSWEPRGTDLEGTIPCSLYIAPASWGSCSKWQHFQKEKSWQMLEVIKGMIKNWHTLSMKVSVFILLHLKLGRSGRYG